MVQTSIVGDIKIIQRLVEREDFGVIRWRTSSHVSNKARGNYVFKVGKVPKKIMKALKLTLVSLNSQ